MAEKGGVIPNKGNPPAAKGIGKNSKRHDLERPTTPGLHDSDLQQGDVSMLEQGQRVTKKRVMQPANQVPQQTQGRPPAQSQAPAATPDAIQFLGGRQGPEFTAPATGRGVNNNHALSWLPLVQQLVKGPGSSGLLASAFINQTRELRRSVSTPTQVVDMDSIDAGLEAMLDQLGA